MKDVLAAVHFRPITPVDLDETLTVQISEIQTESLARACTYPALYFYGVYRQLVLDCEDSVAPMVGFVALEVGASMGFVLRLIVRRDFRRQGVGRATVREAVRRLHLDPEVQVIATSHPHENTAATALFRGEGFVPWSLESARNHPTETFLLLPI